MRENGRPVTEVILLTGSDIPGRLVEDIHRITESGSRLLHVSVMYGMADDTENAEAGSSYDTLRDYLSRDETRLCIVIGYSFYNRVMNGILAPAIERGVRLLVLDNDIQYKQLAERLGISGIKHKVRIENMVYSKWDENEKQLLSGILTDELRRAGG